jgi:hypothetical protein
MKKGALRLSANTSGAGCERFQRMNWFGFGSSRSTAEDSNTKMAAKMAGSGEE